MKKQKQYKVIYQLEPEVDKYELRNGDERKATISWAEFQKLEALMPEITWIIVVYDKLPPKHGRTTLDFNDAR